MDITDLLALQNRQSASATDTASSSSGDTEKAALGRDDFLNMLLAQLKNQDPLDPQDATQFTAQLATFSMLEQLVSIEHDVSHLGDLLEGATVTPATTSPASEQTP
jgi:flagellar basal-body rod modification protein FlgD